MSPRIIQFAMLILLVSGFTLAVDTAPPPADKNTKVKYKSSGEVRFDELLIQGQLERPEVAVVTGDASQVTDGILRLRENFLDRVTVDIGEELP